MACKVTCYFQLFSSVLLSVLRTSIDVLSKSKSRNYVTWIANLTKLFLSVYTIKSSAILATAAAVAATTATAKAATAACVTIGLEHLEPLVLIFCVELQELSHLTREFAAKWTRPTRHKFDPNLNPFWGRPNWTCFGILRANQIRLNPKIGPKIRFYPKKLVGFGHTTLISNFCYKLSNRQNDNYFHSKWQLRPIWVT